MGRAVMLAAALLVATPAIAQRHEPLPLPTEQPALPLLGQAARTANPAARLALIDRALALLVQPTPLRGWVLCGRAATLRDLHRDDEARDAVDQCRQLRPDDPRVLVFQAFSETERQRPVEAAQLLLRAAELDPAAVNDVDPSSMGTVFRLLRYQHQDALADRLIVRLATAGYARQDPETFAGFALVAVRSRVAAGDLAGARALLPGILSPAVGLRLLIDRRLQPIWPDVERWAGMDLSVQRHALREGARGAFELTPTPAHRVAYAVALASTGHRREGIDLLDRWPVRGDDDPWFRNSAAVKLGRWLTAEGRPNDGIARMQAALDGPWSRDPSSANVVPNLAIQLLVAGRAREAVVLLDQRTAHEDGVESPAALGYFVALRACALAGVGRHDEAAALLDRVRTVYAGVRQAVDIATGCVGTPDQAAALWIARAEDPETRGDALVALEGARYARDHGRRVTTLEEVAMRRLLDRGDVQAAYDRFARPVPDGYRPALDDFDGVPETTPAISS